MSVQDGSIPPLLMFRSFLTIASGLVLHNVALYGLLFAIGYAFFPQFAAFLELDSEQQQQLVASDIHQVIPRAMYWSVLAATAVASVGIGIFIGWSAPFGRFVHSVFLAVIVGVSYLQAAMGQDQGKKALMMTCLFIFPLAIMIGGHLITNWMAEDDQAGQRAELLDSDSV